MLKWFNIELGCYPTTIQEFNILKEKIKYAYHYDGLSSSQIRDKFNIPLPDGHMPAFLKQLGIKRRTISEAAHLYYQQGRGASGYGRNGYKCGWHTDWEGNKHYYRSSYELAAYTMLDSKNRKYKTESLRFTYFDSTEKKKRAAIPDIILDNNTIIEVKSKYHYDKQNMIDRFVVYNESGYKTLLLLEGKFLRRLPELNRPPGF